MLLAFLHLLILLKLVLTFNFDCPTCRVLLYFLDSSELVFRYWLGCSVKLFVPILPVHASTWMMVWQIQLLENEKTICQFNFIPETPQFRSYLWCCFISCVMSKFCLVHFLRLMLYAYNSFDINFPLSFIALLCHIFCRLNLWK